MLISTYYILMNNWIECPHFLRHTLLATWYILFFLWVLYDIYNDIRKCRIMVGKCNFGIVPIDKHLSTKNILTYVHSSVSCVHPKSGEYYCIIWLSNYTPLYNQATTKVHIIKWTLISIHILIFLIQQKIEVIFMILK